MAASIGGGVIQMLVSRHPPWRWIPSRPSALPFEVEEAVAEEVEESLRPPKSFRRSAVLLLALPALVPAPSAAAALSIGIPGPKEWLKEQKKKSAKFVLAPIEASRNTLRSAVDLLNDRFPCLVMLSLMATFSSKQIGRTNLYSSLLCCREKVKDGLAKTISSLDKFEQGIKECLGV
ncbi:hypothetical protein BHE74_00002301 [Ensete ventricosum]|nr:hypothetical protein BHE74_00002301 [Ensete ventricosum]